VKIVHSWLRELVDIGDESPDNVAHVAETLTNLGLAIESVDRVGASVPGVVTAEVIRTERHPDAAKVHRVFVRTNDGIERHVWCGAFNMAAGDVIPLATPGTQMPDGRLIEPKPILGIASDGMLCSAKELGLGDDHGGILILAPGTPLGVPYGDALGLVADTVYDIDVLRNRPDCYGHLGVARDLAAKLGVELAATPGGQVPTGDPRSVTVDLAAPDRCPRFTATVMSGIVVGAQSPLWMVARLAAVGMRSINNVVDVSNYLMLERNQPNHAYDLDKLGGGGFRVRCADEGEVMTTLDGVERALSADDLLICDATNVPVGIGGIMGGLDSEISDSTTTIVVECAYFEPVAVARNAARHGLRTEAGIRFDRGVDPQGMPASVARFAELLALTCPNLVVHKGAVDAVAPDHMPAPLAISTTTAAINGRLGTAFPDDVVIGHLASIGFQVSQDGDRVVVGVPSWRPDCTLTEDLAEEVGRLHGFSSIERVVPKSVNAGGLSPVQQRRRRLRQVLLGLGLDEAMPNPFLADDALACAGLDGSSVVRIVNALVADESVMRTSLRPGLLKAVAFNESHRTFGAALFEIGHVYPPVARHGDEPGALPAEYEALGIVLAGAEAPAAVAIWRELVSAMGWGARLDQSVPPEGLHPTRSATLSVGRDVVGRLGEVHPDVLAAFGITERVAIVEANVSILLANEPKVAAWKPTSRFPSSDLDLAFVTPASVSAERVDKAIRQGAAGLLVDLELFDVYRGQGVDAGARSLAYRLRLQAIDRTLADTDIADVRAKVEAAVGKLGATLRA
jgi:phenylalanyl-tRNA synthetase beta chain